MHSTSLLRMLKRSMGLVEYMYIVIIQPASVQIWEMWQLGRDTIMYPPTSNIPGVADRRWIGTQKASQGVWHDQLANSFLPYCRYAGIDLPEEKIVSNSLIDLQDMWVKRVCL